MSPVAASAKTDLPELLMVTTTSGETLQVKTRKASSKAKAPAPGNGSPEVEGDGSTGLAINSEANGGNSIQVVGLSEASVTGPEGAIALMEIAHRNTGKVSISSTDPNGFAWTLHARTHGIPDAFATV